MKRNMKNKLRAGAAFLPVLLTTACVNHMENGEYISTGEILAGAFGNLVIGMGTVFAVLIFLTWVISLFKFVPKLVGGFGKGKKSRAAAPAPAAPAAVKTGGTGPRVTGISPVPADSEIAAVIAAAIAAYEADRESAENTAAPAGENIRPKQGALANGIRIRTYKRA